MTYYQAPIRDMKFLLDEVWHFKNHLQTLPAYQEVDPDISGPVLEEAAKFAEVVLLPLMQSADKEGCHFNQGEVKTPKGFKEAYQQFTEAGWLSLNADPHYGGQGLPKMLQVLVDEMLCSSNVAFSLYTVLTQGAYHAIHLHGTEAMKNTYLPNMVSGKWSGTMCLTEPHCGTDLGLLRTKAEAQTDGGYKITGTKIFITSGEHDLTENIIHTVLARTPDAPAGIKGISLFLVPKYLVNSDGSIGARNPVFCGSIEHKMGIKGSSTCVMNFDGATGYLIGEINQGMRGMFSMMNLERLNIGIEGLGLAETAYQNAAKYAKERLQGRALEGTKYPEKMADPIIVHPDIRKMLLTIRAYTEGCRALSIWVGQQVDIAKNSTDKNQQQFADNFVSLLTPVVKAFFTDYGSEACNLGLQILGGHGYIAEWGMEQLVRDARIAQIYEGTNGVQALDLVKRKLVANEGAYIKQLRDLILSFIAETKSQPGMAEFSMPLEKALTTLTDVSHWILDHAKTKPTEVGAVASDYLRLLALVVLGFMWAKMIHVALSKKTDSFYQNKIHTGRFYFTKLLPQIDTLKTNITAGSDVLMAIADQEF